MAKHGGAREPDGRPAQAPGVGKTAKRHDLEKPRTVPPLSGSDLQSGDVQRLQQAQKVAPIKKGNRASKGGGATTEQRQQSDVEIPDAIDFAGERSGQGIGSTNQAPEPLDRTQWLPLLQALARNPKRSGPLATALLAQLSNITNTPSAGRVRVVDENAIQEAIMRSVS